VTRGETVTITCVAPPIVNRAEGICLHEVGATAEVVWSGFWEGVLARGWITVPAAQEQEALFEVATKAEPSAIPGELAPGEKLRRGKRNGKG
jgi:hypothetical protein